LTHHACFTFTDNFAISRDARTTNFHSYNHEACINIIWKNERQQFNETTKTYCETDSVLQWTATCGPHYEVTGEMKACNFANPTLQVVLVFLSTGIVVTIF